MAHFHFPIPRRLGVAIDLGTAFIRIATEKNDIVTIPAAWKFNPPLSNRVVVEPKAMINLLQPFLGKAKRLGLFRPHVFVGAPTNATGGEEGEFIRKTLYIAGAASVMIVPEPFAAAIGAGMDVSSPYAQMVMDVGEGVTDCVIIRAGEIVDSQSAQVGRGCIRASVQKYTSNVRGLSLSAEETEQIVSTIGVGPNSPVENGIGETNKIACDFYPFSQTISPQEIQTVIEPLAQKIIGAVICLLERVSPELGCEIIESGIVLTGGGASLPGLKERLAEATSIKVLSPARPLEAVIEGLSEMLRNTFS